MILHDEIAVEQRHIDAARLLTFDGQVAACHDPVALALSEQTAYRWITAENDKVMTIGASNPQFIRLPPKVSEWLDRFMGDKEVDPLVFVISYEGPPESDYPKELGEEKWNM